MESKDLPNRTKLFAVNVVRLVRALPAEKSTDVIAKQLVRSGTSVGANYRAACHARSKADFISKLGIVEEEADESVYWMELLVDTGSINIKKVEALIDEGKQLLKIVSASLVTARSRP